MQFLYINSANAYPESWLVSGSSYSHCISPSGLSCRAPITPAGFLVIISYLSNRHSDHPACGQGTRWSFHTCQTDTVITLYVFKGLSNHFIPVKQTQRSPCMWSRDSVIISHLSNRHSDHPACVQGTRWSFHTCQTDTAITLHVVKGLGDHFTPVKQTQWSPCMWSRDSVIISHLSNRHSDHLTQVDVKWIQW